MPCLADGDARLALEAEDAFKVQTKPHGHGDVHSLLHSSGVAAEWQRQGVEWLCFFQDTNGLVFRALPAALGTSSLSPSKTPLDSWRLAYFPCRGTNMIANHAQKLASLPCSQMECRVQRTAVCALAWNLPHLACNSSKCLRVCFGQLHLRPAIYELSRNKAGSRRS